MQNKQVAPSIVTVIGIESAKALSKVFGGTTVYIPKFYTLLIQMRNRQIREDYDAGVKVSQLSAQYNLSDRRIWSILKTL